MRVKFVFDEGPNAEDDPFEDGDIVDYDLPLPIIGDRFYIDTDGTEFYGYSTSEHPFTDCFYTVTFRRWNFGEGEPYCEIWLTCE